MPTTLFYFSFDEWDRDWTHEAYTIDQKAQTIKQTSDGNGSPEFLLQTVNDGIHSWKFKILARVSPIWGLTRFGIVINDEKILSKATNGGKSFGTISNTAYVWECVYTSKVIQHNNSRRWGKLYGRKCKQGDAISMKLDFVKSTLSFSINDQDQGIAHDIDHNNAYRAAVALQRIGDELALLSYEQIA